ncbi:hypothetical protein ACOSP7_018147 [Xanthoceras sorbifolium]|uniref:Glycine-rich protein n=1 Tax=Xanthoceras sorbifolium TaxID=99658 RepID=A0ABQ8I0K6_9ROSI|nr:hypothetical protein JRO89_XS05G0061800 [Xanthoceras sorbifolium]
MAANAAGSETSDGPVFSVINKRIRALRKKYNRIVQMEEAVIQGKSLNKEQEEVLRSKPIVTALIDELDKLRAPLASALSEELSVHQPQQPPSPPAPAPAPENDSRSDPLDHSNPEPTVSDLLNLLYFGSMFDVKSQNDFTATMLTRTHERGCCLTYDYVTDDATDLLGERDLDMISMLSGLLISRPISSSLSHKNALQRCIEHAKLWLSNSDQPVDSNTDITYAGLRERLSKIMLSDYFTTTPEMKAPGEMAAAANYGSFQVPVHVSVAPVSVPVQVEGSAVEYQEEDEDNINFQEHETGDSESSPVEELQKEELEAENHVDGVSVQQEQVKPQAELEDNHGEVESKEQYIPRRPYQNQRGGRGGGRRGYPNGRGGRGSGRGGGAYQNGRSQYYDQPGSYYPRNYYNNRGRGGRGGGYPYNNHGSGVQGGYAAADVGVNS